MSKKLTTQEFLDKVNAKWNNEWELVEGIEYQGLEQSMVLNHTPCGQNITKARARGFVVHYCPHCTKFNKDRVQQIVNKRKQTNLERYGDKNSSLSLQIKEKRKQTNLERYGVEFPLQSVEIQEKRKQTNLERYGVEYISQSEEIKKKVKKTNLERYGIEYSIHSESSREKAKKVNFEKYGVNFPLQSQVIREKIYQNNYEKYGTPYVVEVPQIKEKIKQHVIQKYGRNSPMQIHFTEEQLKFHSIETLEEALKKLSITLDRLPYIDEIIKASGYADNTTLYQIGLTNFSHLYQTRFGFSKAEEEIANFLSQYTEVERHNRTILEGKEIDIYLPKYKCGIEYNGIYWHSSSPHAANGNPKPIDYHFKKREMANSKGIYLIQIFENEYLDNPEKCLEKLLYYTGIQKDFPDLLQKYQVDPDIAEIYNDYIYVKADLCWVNPRSNIYLDNDYEYVELLPPSKFTVDNFELYNAGWIVYRKKFDLT